MSGFPTFPFSIFGRGRECGVDAAASKAANRGDADVEPDGWIGCEALVRIGAVAITGARLVVWGEVRPFALVAGDPARAVRRRFDDATVERLLALAWWDWPAGRISRNLNAIRGANPAALEAAA